ncbi:hypothetical protein [Mesorhizobium sp. ZC-5]|uniref:hypothetical protein n=1 Tax=Mesorhizobium sp. ZC-5 TaxID=2986066 RepID=UPI0021E7AB2A|nr:hypothetical protein [Mesorhizobium sp. ZC-5]MCV3243294.1 hypothetical protein [Mesorhizobium sp. ZC-5]
MGRSVREGRQVKSAPSAVGKELRPTRGLAWLLFRTPGALILWWRYYFAKPGNIALSARQKGKPVMEVGFSLFFWGGIFFTLFLVLVGDR